MGLLKGDQRVANSDLNGHRAVFPGTLCEGTEAADYSLSIGKFK